MLLSSIFSLDMNTSAYSINFCLCAHCSADPVASCWAQTFCTCLQEVWTERQRKAGRFILLIVWRKTNGPQQTDPPTLPSLLVFPAPGCLCFSLATRSLWSCMHLQDTLGWGHYWYWLPLLPCHSLCSLRYLPKHCNPHLLQASQSHINTELKRSCCTCCEYEGNPGCSRWKARFLLKSHAGGCRPLSSPFLNATFPTVNQFGISKPTNRTRITWRQAPLERAVLKPEFSLPNTLVWLTAWN